MIIEYRGMARITSASAYPPPTYGPTNPLDPNIGVVGAEMGVAIPFLSRRLLHRPTQVPANGMGIFVISGSGSNALDDGPGSPIGEWIRRLCDEAGYCVMHIDGGLETEGNPVWCAAMDVAVADLETVCDGPFGAICHSMGGFNTLSYALRHPGLFKAIWMCEPGTDLASTHMTVGWTQPWSIEPGDANYNFWNPQSMENAEYGPRNDKIDEAYGIRSVAQGNWSGSGSQPGFYDDATYQSTVVDNGWEDMSRRSDLIAGLGITWRISHAVFDQSVPYQMSIDFMDRVNAAAGAAGMRPQVSMRPLITYPTAFDPTTQSVPWDSETQFDEGDIAYWPVVNSGIPPTDPSYIGTIDSLNYGCIQRPAVGAHRPDLDTSHTYWRPLASHQPPTWGQVNDSYNGPSGLTDAGILAAGGLPPGEVVEWFRQELAA